MKKRKFLAIFMAAIMSVMSVIPVFANEATYTEDGSASVKLGAEIASGYTVVLPVMLQLTPNTVTDEKNYYAAGYQIGVAGNIEADKYINVIPDSEGCTMSDVSGKRTVNPNVYANKVAWSSDELYDAGPENFVKAGSMIEVKIPRAGKYNGKLDYTFFMSDTQEENSFVNRSATGTNVTNEGELTDQEIINDDPSNPGSGTYTLDLNVDGGEIQGDTPKVTPGQKYGPLPTPEREGYNFIGWFTEKEGGEQITEDSIVIEGQTLWAHWEKVLPEVDPKNPEPTDTILKLDYTYNGYKQENINAYSYDQSGRLMGEYKTYNSIYCYPGGKVTLEQQPYITYFQENHDSRSWSYTSGNSHKNEFLETCDKISFTIPDKASGTATIVLQQFQSSISISGTSNFMDRGIDINFDLSDNWVWEYASSIVSSFQYSTNGPVTLYCKSTIPENRGKVKIYVYDVNEKLTAIHQELNSSDYKEIMCYPGGKVLFTFGDILTGWSVERIKYYGNGNNISFVVPNVCGTGALTIKDSTRVDLNMDNGWCGSYLSEIKNTLTCDDLTLPRTVE